MFSIYADAINSSALKLYCNDSILVDGNTGTLLYGKNINNKVYPASTTKIMTAILAIENLDLNSSVVASKTAIYSIPSDSSTISIQVGEVMSINDLLYGMLLNSGNDAANVIAEAVSGNIPDFVNKMNEKAKELGCTGTHFANAHGYHNNNHYTTASDMMKIFRYALKNDTFKKICETKTYVINETNKTNEKRYLQNTDKLLFTTSESPKGLYYEYALGGKTGYTIEARGTFVGFAKKDDKYVLVGAFDGSQNISGHEARFLDAVTLFNYAFNNYSNKIIINKDTFSHTIIDKTNGKKYIVTLKDNVSTMADENPYTLNYSINIDFNKLYSAINDNNISVGNINYTIKSNNWNLNNSEDLVLKDVSNYISISSVKNYILKYLKYCILLIIIIVIIIIIYIKKRNRKKFEKSYKINYKRRSRKISNYRK